MKKKYFILAILISCFFTIACDKDKDKDNGDVDSALLIGEWDCVKFAYTTDGSKISNVSNISKGNLTIPYAPTPTEQNVEDRWRLNHTNSNLFICSLDGNLIELKLKGSTYAGSPQEEQDICEALVNTYSFVIKGDELLFYFNGVKGKNLLILKKQ